MEKQQRLNMGLTLAIVAHNEEKALARCLDSVLSASGPVLEEVILIDNASTDTTLQVAQSFLNRLPLKIISRTENHLGAARLQCLREAHHKLVIFIDADVVAPRDYFMQWMKVWNQVGSQPCVYALGGGQRYFGCVWAEALNLMVRSPLGHGYSPQTWQKEMFRTVDHVPTFNALFDCSRIDRNRLSLHEQSRVGEDVILGEQLREQGGCLLQSNEPCVDHEVTNSLSAWIRRIFIFGKFHGARPLPRRLWIVLLFLPGMVLSIYILNGGIFFLYLMINLLEAIRVSGSQRRLRWVPHVFILMVLTQWTYSVGLWAGRSKVSQKEPILKV